MEPSDSGPRFGPNLGHDWCGCYDSGRWDRIWSDASDGSDGSDDTWVNRCVNTMVSCSEHLRNMKGDMVLFLHCYIAVNLPQANVGVSRKNGCENRDISHIEIAIEIGNTIINQICSGTLFSNKATCLWGFPKMGLEMVPHPQIHQRKGRGIKSPPREHLYSDPGVCRRFWDGNLGIEIHGSIRIMTFYFWTNPQTVGIFRWIFHSHRVE